MSDLMADWLDMDAAHADELAEASEGEFDKLVYRRLAEGLRAKATELRQGRLGAEDE